jgi:hypothetical protein
MGSYRKTQHLTGGYWRTGREQGILKGEERSDCNGLVVVVVIVVVVVVVVVVVAAAVAVAVVVLM